MAISGAGLKMIWAIAHLGNRVYILRELFVAKGKSEVGKVA